MPRKSTAVRNVTTKRPVTRSTFQPINETTTTINDNPELKKVSTLNIINKDKRNKHVILKLVATPKKDLNELDDNTLNIDGLNSWDKYIKLNNENQY
ncbi:10173_t:CDS:2 [Entrophospora sp. SA101]|nr:17814_t:CDS:2 [Entrophospora sp. SA101]CAJ0758853.1 10173_t:CDS:2 [Entrophospora sp. SA101]CAJ0900122.1 20305_t:CDS:2 [Entrophospora sp. SA101]